jgi:hypothetical protein
VHRQVLGAGVCPAWGRAKPFREAWWSQPPWARRTAMASLSPVTSSSRPIPLRMRSASSRPSSVAAILRRALGDADPRKLSGLHEVCDERLVHIAQRAEQVGGRRLAREHPLQKSPAYPVALCSGRDVDGVLDDSCVDGAGGDRTDCGPAEDAAGGVAWSQVHTATRESRTSWPGTSATASAGRSCRRTGRGRRTSSALGDSARCRPDRLEVEASWV